MNSFPHRKENLIFQTDKGDKKMQKTLKEMIKTKTLPRKQFTPQQRDNAKLVDLRDFVSWYDNDLICVLRGSVRLKENQSLVLYEYGARDFRNERNYNNIDFCINFLGMTYYSAVYALNEYIKSGYTPVAPKRVLPTIADLEKKIADGVYLPAKNTKQVYAYLNKTRGISNEVIKRFCEKDCLYSEKLERGYNILFPMSDDEGNIIGFEKCGALSDSAYRYKGCIICEEYSAFDYQHTRVHNTKEVLIACESAIDLMSILSLEEMGLAELPKNRSVRFLSLRGLQSKVLEKYASRDTEIILCVDSDEAGQNFYNKIKNQYDKITYPEYLKNYGCKDWNELLLRHRELKGSINLSGELPF